MGVEGTGGGRQEFGEYVGCRRRSEPVDVGQGEAVWEHVFGAAGWGLLLEDLSGEARSALVENEPS